MEKFSMLALGLKKFRRRYRSGFPPVVVSTFFNLYFDKPRSRSAPPETSSGASGDVRDSALHYC